MCWYGNIDGVRCVTVIHKGNSVIQLQSTELICWVYRAVGDLTEFALMLTHESTDEGTAERLKLNEK